MTRMAIAETIREYFHQVQDYREKKRAAKDDPTKMPKFDQGLENGELVLDKNSVEDPCLSTRYSDVHRAGEGV